VSPAFCEKPQDSLTHGVVTIDVPRAENEYYLREVNWYCSEYTKVVGILFHPISPFYIVCTVRSDCELQMNNG
jgi:hypothetical protein